MEEENKEVNDNEESLEKEIYIPGLTLGIGSIIVSLIVSILGLILGIMGIVFNIIKKDEMNTKIGLILSFIGTGIAIVNSIYGLIILLS